VETAWPRAVPRSTAAAKRRRYSHQAATSRSSEGSGAKVCTKVAPRGSGRPATSRDPVLGSKVFHPHLREPDRGGQPRDAPGDDPEPGDARRLVAAVEEHLHPDADPEEGTPISSPGASRGFEAAGLQREHARAEVADAGQDHGIGGGDLPGVGREPRVGSEVLERLLGRSQVPDSVVDDPRSSDFSPTTFPWWRERRCPRLSTSVPATAPTPTPLKDASITWWPFLPVRLANVCSVTRGGRRRSPSRTLRRAAGRRCRSTRRPAPRRTRETAAREVERDLHECFVERQRARWRSDERRALVAQCFSQRVAEDDADILHGVVQVDFEIATRFDPQIEARVLAELLEHVVEEGDPVANRRGAGTVDVRARDRPSSSWSCASAPRSDGRPFELGSLT